MVTEKTGRWVLLTYRVAREPSARRVGIWRKLKRLGALLVHDSVWVLPASPRAIEQFQWLAAEVRELEGDAMLWQASLSNRSQDEGLVAQFLEQVDGLYGEILASLQTPDADLAALSKRFQQARTLDFFNSPLGVRVRQALLEAAQEASR